MPTFGNLRKAPVMLGERMNKAKNAVAHLKHMGSKLDGFLGKDDRHNARNIPVEGLGKTLEKLLKRKKALDEEAGAVERMAEKL